MLKMKKLWAVAVIAVAGFVAAPSQALAANTCADLLLGKAYFCSFKFSDGSASDRFVFFDEGYGGSGFSGVVEFWGDMHCDCKAKGSFNNPKFAESTSFQCAGLVDSEEGEPGKFALEGKAVAGGDKIKKGQTVDDFGTTVFECEVVEEPS